MLRQAMENLEHSYDVTLEALGDALDLKDSETEGHSKRVTAYTIALARAMGVHPAQIKVIARGAFLHDIGKMAIPDDILRKAGTLKMCIRDSRYGDWRKLFLHLDDVDKVTKADIRRVANQVFIPSNRTSAWIETEAPAQAPAAAKAPAATNGGAQ